MTENPTQGYDVRFNDTPDGPLLVRGLEAFELNEVGLAIWQRCDGLHTEQEIVEAIRDMYGVSEEQARADVTFFLTELGKARLLDA